MTSIRKSDFVIISAENITLYHSAIGTLSLTRADSKGYRKALRRILVEGRLFGTPISLFILTKDSLLSNLMGPSIGTMRNEPLRETGFTKKPG